MTDNLLIVGEYSTQWSEMLKLPMEKQSIYMHTGLRTHIERRHPDCLAYLSLIPDIIRDPDFIGVNPRETPNQSIELIKKYGTNILIGIKLDIKNHYLYVATLHDLSDYKVNKRLHSNRLKKFQPAVD